MALRAMEESDIETVLSIIEDFDEDDAEHAAETFATDGLDGTFVFQADWRVIGVTGYAPIEGSEDAYWLSWTYLAESERGKGVGTAMLDALFWDLYEKKARKLFVQVSDYIDPEDGDVYAAARHLYRKSGFSDELKFPDYYDVGESMTIMGFDMSTASKKPVHTDISGVQLGTLQEIDETTGSLVLTWEPVDELGYFTSTESNFTTESLRGYIAQAEKLGARKVFMSFPSDVPNVESPLLQTSFKHLGRLIDFYDFGVHEEHFVFDIR